MKSWKFHAILKIPTNPKNSMKSWKFHEILKIPWNLDKSMKSWKFHEILKFPWHLENSMKSWKFNETVTIPWNPEISMKSCKFHEILKNPSRRLCDHRHSKHACYVVYHDVQKMEIWNFEESIVLMSKRVEHTQNFTLITIMMVPRLQDLKKCEFLRVKVGA